MVAPEREALLSLLERVGHQDESEIDLADTALLLGALDAPNADLTACRQHTAQLRSDLVDASAGASSTDNALNAIRDIIYQRHGYSGDSESYDDLRNANLIHVIERKRGLPVALGILCINAAQAAGWDLAGLNFPSHFLLRLEMPPERAIVDPFDACSTLDAAEIRSRLKEMLGSGAEFHPSYFEPVGARHILLRLQNNIKMRAIRDDKDDTAIDVLTSMALIAPHEEAVFNERAVLYARRGELNTAIGSLSAYLDREQSAEDHPDMVALLKNLRSSLN